VRAADCTQRPNRITKKSLAELFAYSHNMFHER
jgi:hypothetical protein